MSHNALDGANVNLAVQRGLQRRVDTAFRNALEVGFTQRHVNDIEAVIARRPDNFAGKPEPGQHTVRIVIGSTADEGDHTGNGFRGKSTGAQVNSCLLGRVHVVAADQQLHLAAPGRPADIIRSSAAEHRIDRAWLGMRTADGVAADLIPPATIDWLVAPELAERRADRICPTLRGFLMADRIAARLVEPL